MLKEEQTDQIGPDKTPDEIHKDTLTEIEKRWKAKEINFGQFRRLVARADYIRSRSTT